MESRGKGGVECPGKGRGGMPGEREGWNARGKGGVECPGKGKGEMLRERKGRNGR